MTRATLPVYDDALFFRRFALNLLDHAVYAWNVADGPVHGSTSQLWQVLVTGLAAITRDHTVQLGRTVLAGSLLAAVAFALRGASARAVVLLGLLGPVALATVVSGMETATTLGLGVALLAAPRAAGPLAVLLALARPDTLLLSLPTLAFRRQWGHLAMAMAGVAGALLLFAWGYGSALPLSFALKAGPSTPYGETFLALSAVAGRRHLLMAALALAPLVAWARDRRWLVPAALFVGFHALVTVDVMGMHARFYAPALPWIVWAARDARPRPHAALGVWALLMVGVYAGGLVPGDRGWEIGRLSPWTWGATTLAGVLVGVRGQRPWAAPAVIGLTALGVLLSRPALPDAPLDDEATARRLARSTTSWRGLKQARRCLGAEAHVAHSEIGVPGVFFDRVTDLAGLMNPDKAAGQWDFEAWCAGAQPELLFLPHRNYARMNAEIAAGACIGGYVRVVEKGSSPLHVRRDLVEAYRCDAAR